MIPRGAQDPEDPNDVTVAPDGRPGDEQPKWRRDFPIDWPHDEYVSRRAFVGFTVLTSAAFAAGQLWIVAKRFFDRSEPREQAVPIAEVDSVPVGGATTFTYPEGSSPRLLVRTGERSFVAYDQQCTHLMCPVVPAVESGRLHCPCHNGWFDLSTGNVISGPPQRPLARVRVEVREDTVYALGVERPAG